MAEEENLDYTGFGYGAIRNALSSSSTTLRIQKLEHLNEEHKRYGAFADRGRALLELLFDTYTLYQDRESRLAVQRLIKTLLNVEEAGVPLTKFFSKLLRDAANRVSIPASESFVLVEWFSLLIQDCAGNEEKTAACSKEFMTGLADMLEVCQGPASKLNIRKSALTVSRRALRKLFTQDSETTSRNITRAVKDLTGAAKPKAHYAILLGVVAGVCARKPPMKEVLETLRVDYICFYNTQLLASRTVLPPHVADGLHDYYISFTNEDEITKQVMPQVEKGLLRAPEVLLNNLVSPLINALPESIDLSPIVQKSLLKPLIANIKSSNATIRDGALTTFKAAIPRCRDNATLNLIVDEIANPLRTGKVPSADHRVMFAEVLKVLPVSEELASKVLPALAAVAGKETNETALNAELTSLCEYATWSLSNKKQLPKPVLDAFAKGAADKKPPIRRLWTLRISDILWAQSEDSIGDSTVVEFAEAVSAPLTALFAEVVANALTAAQSGLAVCAYAITALALKLAATKSAKVETALKKAQILQQALVLEPKPSYLLNYRVYSKLMYDDDYFWLARALAATSAQAAKIGTDSAVAVSWSLAVISSISSATTTPAARRECIQILSQAYVKAPEEISSMIICGLWRWIHLLESGEKDTAAAAAKTDKNNLHHVVRSICLPAAEASKLGGEVSSEVLENQMVKMLIIARPELVPGIYWIDLCLRVGVDPGKLASTHSEALIDQVVNTTKFDESTAQQEYPVIKKAAFNATAELAFVNPEVMTPRIVEIFQNDLDPKQLDNVGPTEAAIFRTPEGTAFVDVLAKKSNDYVPNKNTKDYDTLKWEAEVRAQLAAKKGTQKKLTPEENAKVAAQLKKEAAIRLQVQVLEAKLIRGVGIIESLATGPPTEAQMWMGPAVSALIKIITAGAGLVTGNLASQAYQLLSVKVADRIAAIRPFIGVSILRALDVEDLPEELCQEGLGEVVTRVLYRLRFAGEQRPFDTVSLTYILPLVFLVLRNGGFGSTEDSEAQVILALEFISFHTDAASDTIVPRDELLSVLIESMQKYKQHYKTIKECLADLCRCIAPTINDIEIAILARGAIVPEVDVRTSVLSAISAEIDMSEMPFSEEVWLACHDDYESNVELGQEIWEESGFEVSPKSVSTMLPYLERADKQLRRAAARALASALKQHRTLLPAILSRLQETYIVLAKPKVPQLDEYGMPRKMDLSDPWEARNGIALAFRELAVVFNESLLDSFLQFLIERGPLGDKSAVVRDEMVEAARAIIELHAKNKVEALMKTFENTLEAPDQGSEFYDRVNEAVIILYGALAKHLEPGDARVPKVVDRLLATLSTPSETVQYAVAMCLPDLVQASRDKIADYIHTVMDQLVNGKTYAARRGAAYGLAGLVKGAGIYALREYRIMSTLRAALENKKEPKHREGAYLAYELLSTILGRMFEPYVIQIVPQLLAGFGDSSNDVREGCLAAAKACFANLSSFGVMKILPTLLEGLDEDQWRSKKGACDLLGAMAYLDPQQLAQSLPEIIPPLTGVLNDSHKEVRLAANRSLKRFGEVINNPEIKSLVSILLKALSDPTRYTEEALDALIKVSFVHYLDAPSLALVVRILERGLGDRSGTKRKSAQVIGSLAHLTERKDLMAHLPILVAGLKVAAVDPVPTTRATGSKALGSLIEKLGEDALPDLIPGLMQALKTDTGAGDRLGSAQALSEVLAGLGTSRLEETLPTILQNVSSSKSAVREGFMSLFIFLPVCFGNAFASYLSKIIPPILTGLADEVESIRETALRAGRLLVKNFATKSIDLLLPELERGLGDDNYRIRLSSVELVGDLLFNLTGISASADDDDVEEGAREAGASLLEVLGEEKRNKVLSELYICRCDSVMQVRNAAINVWKALVASPKTLIDLVPTLSHLIISRLGSSNAEQKTIAGNALGELIRKAGDKVLSTLLPTLEDGLRTSTDVDARQGICMALRELITSAGVDSLEDHFKTLVSVIRVALVDSDEDVREAAADAFDELQGLFHKRAVDEVLPYLLNLLRTESEAENALNALLTLLGDETRSRIILPTLLPTLIASPISAFNARAVASLSTVASHAMAKNLSKVVNALLDNIIAQPELKEDLTASLDTVVVSINDEDDLSTLFSVMFTLVKHADAKKRAIIAGTMQNFFAHTELDYAEYHQEILRNLLTTFADTDATVVKNAWAALNEFTKHLEKYEMEELVMYARQILRQVGTPGQNLPGFSDVPKGITAILPIFLQGLVNGSADQKATSAMAISDIVSKTSEDGLKPSALIITGPLIRFVTDRSPEVKAAILKALDDLLTKVPAALKAFLPQLQRTFAKSLADTSSEVVRNRAAAALGKLINHTPRVDPLIAELVAGSKTEDVGIRLAMMKALYQVVDKAGQNMSTASGKAILDTIDTINEDDEDHMPTMIANATLFGALINSVTKSVGADKAAPLLVDRAVQTPLDNISILALNAVLKYAPTTITETSFCDGLPGQLVKGIEHKDPFVADNAILAAGKFLLLLSNSEDKFQAEKTIYDALSKAIVPGKPVDGRRLALLLVKVLAYTNINHVKPHLKALATPIFSSLRDTVIPVKLAAEAAWMEIFEATEGSDVFDTWIAAQDDLPPATSRSMKDYFKRITLKIAKQKKEQREENEWMAVNERKEDMREVQSVGKVNLEEEV